jgi:prevent-host-death family protein
LEVVAVTTISSREFNQDVSAAKRAAAEEPVIITDRGEPSHVLLSIQEYRRLLADRRSIVDWLSAEDDIELPEVRLDLRLSAPEL